MTTHGNTETQVKLIDRIAPVKPGSDALRMGEGPSPEPDDREARLQARGVCHTESDEIGDCTPLPNSPTDPCHEIGGGGWIPWWQWDDIHLMPV